MTTPERPLDARRAQLRALGCTDDEISRIIVDELKQQPQPQAAAATGTGGVPGQTGVMSGVLNNLSVAMALATGFLPSLATDITNLIGGDSLHVRSKAGVYLAVKLALVTVIGFAIYQEYQKHIFSETITAAEQSRLTKAQADAANLNIEETLAGDETPQQKAQRLNAACMKTESAAQMKADGVDFSPKKVKELCNAKFPIAS